MNRGTHWARATSPHAGPDRGFMFLPEVGDEVAVAFEDGDPERPVILGSMWNGVQQAPRGGFFAPTANIPENDVKRLMTKSGNRLQMVDAPGQETMVVATPNHNHVTLTEKSTGTGRPLVHLHSDGDIILSAPNGRVHIQSQFFSREIGSGAPVPAAGETEVLTSPKAGSDSAHLQTVSWQNPPDGRSAPHDTASGKGKTTTITRADGPQEIRHGSRAWRDNNPGDITWTSKDRDPFALRHGAIGSEGGKFAIFPDQKTGFTALHALLDTDAYQSRTIQETMNRFAPADDKNDPVKYANDLSSEVGSPVDTKLSKVNQV